MKKPMTHLIASLRPGPCTACRHANQGTVDKAEGLIFCQIDGARKHREQHCDVERDLVVGDGEMRRYYLYEPFTGDNGTYGRLRDRTIAPEDAPPEVHDQLRRRFG